MKRYSRMSGQSEPTPIISASTSGQAHRRMKAGCRRQRTKDQSENNQDCPKIRGDTAIMMWRHIPL
jgi:hypothetical protein